MQKLELIAEDPEDLTTSSEYRLEADAWVGGDVNKLWLRTDMRRSGGRSREIELQLLYRHALTAYWDLQLGVRHDTLPKPGQDWAVIGLRGLAPLYIDADAALFVGESGQTSLRVNLRKDLIAGRILVLKPELEINAYGRNDDKRNLGSGFAELRAGLRLALRLRPEFAPYIGVDWVKKFGNTAELTRAMGEEADATRIVVGVSGRF